MLECEELVSITGVEPSSLAGYCVYSDEIAWNAIKILCRWWLLVRI